ncbi:MAG TPA: DUF3857 domain-containing protein [Flavobacterium sp.]
MLRLIPLLFVFTISAQQQKLGKVTIADLKESAHLLDSTAAAAILYKSADVYFEATSEGFWNVITDVEVRIKIYNKQGYDYGNFKLEYYSGPHGETVSISDAATYNLVDGKVERTKLKKEGEFTQEIRENYKEKKITLPNVKEGSIVEYKYTVRSYNNVVFDDFHFQYDIPVDFIKYRVCAPDFFEYNRMLVGYLKPTRTDEYINNVNRGYNEHRINFTMQNVPALKEESFVNNINNYRSKLKQELSATKDKQGNIKESYATTWEAVAKKIYDDSDFGSQLNKDSYFEEDLTAILVGAATQEEKVTRIFDFVQSRMAWNEYNGFFCKEGVKNAYKNKSGNVADINLMLTAMLRHAGINANPVLISTRSNGVTVLPSRAAYNYVVAGIETDKDPILLDASSKNTRPGILPLRALNWFGRIIRKDGSSAEVNLMPTSNSKEAVSIMASINTDGSVSGKMRDQYNDYNAYTFREQYIGISEDSYLQKLEGKYKGIEISEYEVANSSELAKPVMETYSFPIIIWSRSSVARCTFRQCCFLH